LLAIWVAQSHGGWKRDAAFPAFKTDRSWGPVYNKGDSRLKCDGNGALFLALGDSLLISEGATWRRIPLSQSQGEENFIPIALARDGKVAWGRAISLDRGRSWSAWDRVTGAASLAWGPEGKLFFGGGSDMIHAADDSARFPRLVHNGNTLGRISAFAPLGPDAWLAAPDHDFPILSLDGGETWQALQDRLPSEDSALTPMHYFATDPLDSGRVWAFANGYAKRVVFGGPIDKGLIQEIRLAPGGPRVRTVHPGAGYPDSAITALLATRDASDGSRVLCLGTWGQGVFFSRDGGLSWARWNAGLVDLHVEALASGPDGSIHLLAKDGLYTSEGNPLALAPARSAPDAGRRLGPGFPGLFGSGTTLYRPDGRKLTLP
jgi:hypothetical protein